MHNPVAAMRAGRPRTRFTTAQPRRRERQLGLLRSARVIAARPAATGSPARPRDALRQAARSIARTSRGELRLGRSGSRALRWNRRTSVGLRVVRSRSAAPWRG